MQEAAEHERELEALRERLTRLSEASLRVNESLDPDTVLQEVMDGARSLTGARFGGITTFDESGQLVEFITSGLPPEEQQQMLDLPEGPALFEYFSSIQGSLRFADVASHMRALGFPDLPIKTLLGAPMRHRGEHVGNLYVAEKEGGREFTREDEETLVLFASQATMVVVNARRHRDEQRARADLEALINTSPVGVLVFDATSGALASLNREARRIFDELRPPGRPLESLLEVLTFKRDDGREVSLEEFPLAQTLSTGETVRAEEIVIQVPDGRSVTTLINATPIHSQEGQVESVVVTLQDMTPLEDLERLRAEFLAMVSHELQTPLASIRGSAATLLDDEPDLDPAEMRQFHRMIQREASRMRALISDLLDVARIETGTLPVAPAPAELAVLVDEARNAFLNAGGGNNLLIDLPQDLPWVMADRWRIVQVLGNLLANAAAHSPDSSSIRVTAVRDDGHVAVSVADEGRGVAAERLPHLFRKFSRTDGGNRGRGPGGSGLGLAICRGIVEAHGGRIWAESDGEGMGARLTFTIPVVVEAGIGAQPDPPGSPPPSRRSQREQKRVLAVDDDPRALRYVRDALSRAGYTPIVTADPEEVPRLLEEERPHLVLLDLMLPGTDGIELMKDIFDLADVPVIFLSVYGQEDVIARAFDAGATDYVVKPFSPTELAARIRAALDRRGATGRPRTREPYVLGDLTIDYAERRVSVAGRPVRLTAIEHQLLVELSLHAGLVLTHDHLLRRVWGLGSSGDLRPLRTAVKNLRRKLGEDAGSPGYIFTERRVGYRMAKGEGLGEQEA